MTEEEIRIGSEILDHMVELGKIMEKVKTAYAHAESCKANINTGSTYNGKAAEELQLFCSSLASNLQRMIFLYMAAMTYIENTYKTMYYNEQQLVDFVIGQMGE